MLICLQGDANPRIVALQILLNRSLPPPSRLKVDGHYGGKTAAAVQWFRNEKMQTSGRGDVVDGPVWEKLLLNTGLQIVDVVDITDPDVLEGVVPEISQFTIPILIAAMSNGVAQAMTEIKARVKGAGSLLLVRFHGHGAPGLAAISHGSRRVSPGINPILAQSVFTVEVVKALRHVLQDIAPLMHDFGFVEFHSCRVAQGPSGPLLLRQLCELWKAPVTGGLSKQQGAGRLNFILQQPSSTAFPGGANLKSWAATRQEGNRVHFGVLPL